MESLRIRGRWSLFHSPATLCFDPQTIAYRSGKTRITISRTEVTHGTIWLVSDRHDGESQLTLFREDETVVARIPLSEFQYLNNLETTIARAVELRNAQEPARRKTVVRTEEHFDSLFTCDCHYCPPWIQGSTIRIPVRQLALMSSHPARIARGKNLEYVENAVFVFEGVSSSKRTLTPYIGDPKQGNFGARYESEDGPFEPRETTREYGFEGILDSPCAYVDWVITAEKFILEP